MTLYDDQLSTGCRKLGCHYEFLQKNENRLLELLDEATEREKKIAAAWELSEEAARFLLRTGHWIRQEDRDRALAMLDRARAGGSQFAPPEKG